MGSEMERNRGEAVPSVRIPGEMLCPGRNTKALVNSASPLKVRGVKRGSNLSPHMHGDIKQPPVRGSGEGEGQALQPACSVNTYCFHFGN